MPKMNNVSIEQKLNHIPLLTNWYLGSNPFYFFPIPPNETFPILYTQPSKMQGYHWKKNIANSCQILYFDEVLGRKKYTFFKHQKDEMMPEPQQFHPSVCSWYTIYAAFHLFKFRQEENTGVHDVNVLSFITNYMYYFKSFNVIVQPLQNICVCLYSF